MHRLDMTRRNLLGTAAIGTAAAMLPTGIGLSAGVATAQTVPPQAGAQLPGAFRYKVGTFEVTALHDGYGSRPLDDKFIINAPLDQVQAALTDVFRPTDKLNIPYTASVVHTGSQVVLLDTGTGGKLGPTAGTLSRNMAAAGIDPASITTIIISHFHPDHISGIKAADNKLAFPNAEILVPEAEWAYWTDDGEMSRAAAGRKPNFELVKATFGDIADRVRRYKSEEEILPGMTAVAAYGHTPGHTALQINSGSETLMVLADVTNVPFLFVRNPDWSPMFDMDAAMARETRKRLLDRMAADRAIAVGYHWGLPNAGHIRRDGNGYDFIPLPYTQTL